MKKSVKDFSRKDWKAISDRYTREKAYVEYSEYERVYKRDMKEKKRFRQTHDAWKTHKAKKKILENLLKDPDMVDLMKKALAEKEEQKNDDLSDEEGDVYEEGEEEEGSHDGNEADEQQMDSEETNEDDDDEDNTSAPPE